MPEEKHWETALSMDIRGNTAIAGFWNPRNRTAEIVSAYSLPGEWNRKKVCSDSEILRRVCLALDEDVREEGIEYPGYVLCIPDDFSVKERIEIQAMAERAGICLIRMVEESCAAAISMCEAYAFNASFLVVKDDDRKLVCSLYHYEDKVLEIQEKSSFSLDQGPERAIEGCLRQFSGLAFAKNDERVFMAPALVLLIGSSEQTRRAKGYLEELFGGMTDGRQTRYLTGDPTDLYSRGTAIYAGELAANCRRILFVDSIQPHKMFVQVSGKTWRMAQDTVIPFTTDISWLIGKEPESQVVLLEENAQGLLEPAAAGTIRDGLSEGDSGILLSVDREKRFLLSQGERTEVMLLAGEETAHEKKNDAPDELILNFMGVADSLEYGMQGIQDPDDAHLIGLKNIFRKITEIFAMYGIERYGEAGETFDPQIHNAVVHVTDIDLPENCIRQVVQSGYRSENRVIRYASVVVAN